MEIQNTWYYPIKHNWGKILGGHVYIPYPEFYLNNFLEREQNMKTYKLEFVLFNISHENAVFLWKWIVDALQFFSFDVTGNVSEVENSAFSEEE